MMMKSVAAETACTTDHHGETGHLSGWPCDNFMADAYGCDTEYDDGEECPDFESKR